MTYLYEPTSLPDKLLGQKVGVIKFKVADNTSNPNYKIRNGDAAFLEKGEVVYSVIGYSPKFRIAVKSVTGLKIYEADNNPQAKRGKDLLDIEGKVASVSVNIDFTRTQIAKIDNPKQVTKLVNMVLDAPVDQNPKERKGQRFLVEFVLKDGSSVYRGYWTESRQLGNGIIMPDEFQKFIEEIKY